MDALSDVLQTIKLKSSVYFRSDFSAPWGMKMEAGKFAQFHLVVRGNCWLKLSDSKKPIELSAGDIILFPHGDSHSLSDKLGSKKYPGKKVLESILNNKPIFYGDRISATLVCGHFEFDDEFEHGFVSELPNIIHIKDNDKKELHWLEKITNLVIQEAGNEGIGRNLVVKKLGEILFIYTIRAFIHKNNPTQGFLAALQNKNIGEALSLIHNSPGTNWTLNTLSRASGMSRTNFINKFKQLVGETPLNYITNIRILKAKELLADTKKPVGELAKDVGYKSEAAFNRVFKKRVAQTPFKYRHNYINKN
jgi:AraC-like DNA-binding protein